MALRAHLGFLWKAQFTASRVVGKITPLTGSRGTPRPFGFVGGGGYAPPKEVGGGTNEMLFCLNSSF
jgi:hypothetical protein